MRDTDFDVVVVGDLNADIILQGDVEPAWGQVEKLVDEGYVRLGGSSSIFAHGAARLGLRVAFIGKIGDDALGHMCLDELNAVGVDTSGVVVDPKLRSGFGVALAKGTDRAILTYLGSIAELTLDDINWDIVRNAQHMHTGAFFLLKKLMRDYALLARRAKQHGLTVSLDTNYDPLQQWYTFGALQAVDWFMPNENELKLITGKNGIPVALESLKDTGVVVKRGTDGASLYHAGQVLSVDAYLVDAVDATGAGDSFDAGFIYGLSQGYSLIHCLQWGAAAGALSTRQAGGTAAQPTTEEVRTFLAQANANRGHTS